MLGLDRIPEVKTLREKLEVLAQPAAVSAWAEDLSTYWMRDDETLAGVLYVDGHVRSYTGSQTKLPRRFSSRDRLCVRSLMDYWVNDRDGTPFFVVTALGNEGMLHYLRTTIIPRLLREVPNQPSDAELAADPDRHRFVLVFDREGWSPVFFAELWRAHRIAVQTYRRGTYEPWPVESFAVHNVDVAHGHHTTMRLADQAMKRPARGWPNGIARPESAPRSMPWKAAWSALGLRTGVLGLRMGIPSTEEAANTVYRPLRGS